MRVLGLTGGIGSGKSTVASMFTELGAEVIDADQLARDVVEPGQPALEEIVQAFGADIVRPDGQLDRAKLGSIVFADAAARSRLNAITHRRIRERMHHEVQQRSDRQGLLLLDIPLLYENARSSLVEKVIVVWVDAATQLRRLTERSGLSSDEATRRIASQMSLDEKRAQADIVIDNTGSLESTRRQVAAIYRELIGG
ncbi:MAG TPA: dephospho-CoA kinase [Candidatus Acidoferrum sp.]|nr:dephospho-CoA kinase [Candidatus Acidoferrum sp.]